MIVSRTPLRISFSGGGSDLPAFYSRHGGCVLSTTINKYIYITLQDSFTPGESLIKYSSVERFKDVSEIAHPIFRECMLDFGVDSLEMASLADVPAGTGLGSSSAFTVGLINLLSEYTGRRKGPEELARAACEMEIVKLREPVGKQDQYAAAYGGMNFLEFDRDGTVRVSPLKIDPGRFADLERNMAMFYTGVTRSASRILFEQSKITSTGSSDGALLEMCDLTEYLRKELERGNIDAMGDVLAKGWDLKKTLSGGISTEAIDDAFRAAGDAGAHGGKLLGAGGGGFLLFYAPEECHGDIAKALSGYREYPFRFENTGSTVIYNDADCQTSHAV